MFKKLAVYLQYVIPQHLLSRLIGVLANSKSPILKNFLIKRFIKRYQVDLSLAKTPELDAYPSFNDFFIRAIKPQFRPIDADPNIIASPCDGTIAQIGCANQNQLLQAKNFYFDVKTLLGNQAELADHFTDGCYATFYLSPKDYHRVHMPLTGKLLETIYVPGKLFSVNRITSEIIPNIFSRNERLISIFDTEVGKMAVIMVGAMIVGHINMVWAESPARDRQLISTSFANTPQIFPKGAELGYFSMGSTVMVLFKKDTISWLPDLKVGSNINFGQNIGKINQ